MKTVFADSSYWIAVLNPHDRLHDRALQESALLTSVTIVTSEMVCTEVLNYFADTIPAVRSKVAHFFDQLQHSPLCEIVPQTSYQFKAALHLYRQRADKKWSLTDCATMLAMKSMAIRDILTADKHFEQAGFMAILKQPKLKIFSRLPPKHVLAGINFL